MNEFLINVLVTTIAAMHSNLHRDLNSTAINNHNRYDT